MRKKSQVKNDVKTEVNKSAVIYHHNENYKMKYPDKSAYVFPEGIRKYDFPWEHPDYVDSVDSENYANLKKNCRKL